MTKENGKVQGNIVIFLVIAALGVFLFLKFLAPKLGIKLFKKDDGSIEYSHAEGFPKVLNVSETFAKTRLVITTQEDLEKAIKAVDKNNEVKIPTIDFTKKVALFVTSKTNGSGGYEIKIKKITKDQEDLKVEIRDTVPGKTCLTTEALTLAMDLVTLDKTPLSIEFNVTKSVKECN